MSSETTPEIRKSNRGTAKHNYLDVPPIHANPDPRTLPSPQPVFTQTESRILNVLADGKPHKKKELIDCLMDEMSDKTNLWRHIHSLRKKIRPYGGSILCVFHMRQFCYQRVKLYNH